MAACDARQPTQSALRSKSGLNSTARKFRLRSPFRATFTEPTLLSGFLILALICSSCASSEQARPSRKNESPEVSVATDQSSLPHGIRDCLEAAELVAESLRAVNTESALKAQETCRNAMVDLNADGQGTRLGTRMNAASQFISDLNSAISSAIISAGGGALSAEDTDRLDSEYRSAKSSVERVLDPNSPFVGMTEQ